MAEPEPSKDTGGCLDDPTILAFVGRTLDAGAVARVERHVATCEACRVLVSAAVQEAYSAGTVPTVPAPTSRRPSSALLRRGSTVGRYLVLDLIGRGGTSEVYAAYDPDLARRLALKVLHTAAGTQEARARLVREARALGRLSHPNVVQVYDVGVHEGDVFLAMELVVGEHLGAWLRRSPRPSWEEVLAAYLEAARGLSAAHAQGLVHRDVKPSSIVRAGDGRVRVIDFGLVGSPGAEASPEPPRGEDSGPMAGPGEAAAPASKAPSSFTLPLTREGTVMGTPRYMAPEQFEGTRVGRAADQYSLCLALYEGVYATSPFEEPAGASPPDRFTFHGLKQYSPTSVTFRRSASRSISGPLRQSLVGPGRASRRSAAASPA